MLRPRGLLQEPNGGSGHRGRLDTPQPRLRSLVDDRGDLRGRLTLLTSDLVGVADLFRADGGEDRYPVNTSDDIFQLKDEAVAPASGPMFFSI